MEKVIEECLYDTHPVDMEGGVNDEVDDENRNNFIEENKIRVNDEY